MKKLLLILFFIPCLAQSQNLDTVLVRNLQLQAQDWAWIVSQAGRGDSVTLLTIRRVRTKIQATANLQWTSNINVDSLPGRTVLQMYQLVLNSPAAEIATRYTAIKSAIAAKANLAYWIGFIDAQGVTEFERKKNIGKNILVDN